MTTKETKIEFINLEFTENILNSFVGSRGFTAGSEDLLILSMNWPWRSPDVSDFNSAYTIPIWWVIDRDELVREGKIGIRPSEQLRIRTIAQGASTIRFSLIYVDISSGRSVIGKILGKIGEVLIGKLTGGMSILISAGVKAAANYNLERIVDSASGKKTLAEEILGQATLNFDSETDQTEKMKLISIQKSNQEILKLYINVIRGM